ncbi:MAG: hypothetical protein KF841_03575 [Phycisphaerae bacterium]|nr:hypothetical protein [Phycisphaerae bacterium]
MRRIFALLLLTCLISTGSGCAGRIFGEITSWQPSGNPRRGITYYVGGAGPMGHVGSFDVPGGLRDGGYEGDVRVFTWQSWLHSGDQLNISRNRAKGIELADRIRQDRRMHPGAKINIIALSAGTGITTFALEALPESAKVSNVLFLGCSMSSRYDLTRALRRVQNRLYIVYSPTDGILRNVVWYTGTVDRSDSEDGIAGLEGFYVPATATSETRQLYQKLANIRYRPEFALSDYRGGHVDSTSRLFVRRYLAPIVLGNDSRLVGHFADRRSDDFQPTRASQNMPDPLRGGGEVDVDRAESETTEIPAHADRIDTRGAERDRGSGDRIRSAEQRDRELGWNRVPDPD